MSGHFQPDAELVSQLKRRCKELAGHDFVEVRWHPDEECLAIFERHRADSDDAPGVVRTFLLDDKNKPRQLNQGDVNEVVNAIYGRREMVDNWKERWEAKQEAAKLQEKEERHERSMEAAKEMVRIHNFGPRAYAFMGAADSVAQRTIANANLDSGKPYSIVDQYGQEYDD